jgi:hypothetical protein
MARLGAAAARLDCFELGRHDGAGWHPLDAALDDGWVAEQVDRLAEGSGHGRRPRTVAVAYLAGGLSWAVAVPVTAMLVTEHVALDPAIGNVAVHVDQQGWPSRIALVRPRVTVLPGDLAAGRPNFAVAPSLGTLVESVADGLADAFAAIFAVVRRAGPYGISGMWGTLADDIASTVWLLHEHGSTARQLDHAWTVAEGIIDALQVRQPALRARPRRFHFSGATPPVDLPMRGTCCLYYRTPEAAADGDDGMCTTCPRRTDEQRVQLVNGRFARHHQ